MDNLGQCRALNVSDEKQCVERATSVNGLFCAFHSKQCQGLYRGYKARNARLDHLSMNPPKYLAETKTALPNETFERLKTGSECREIRSYLFLKYQLLDRVIRARKMHHTAFFSLDMDYGHAKYLDALQGQKATVQKALERLDRKTAEVLYGEQKWWSWVREVQDEEDSGREKEKERMRLEAAMFRRNKQMVERRERERGEREERRRQGAYLEQVYKERLAEKVREGENDEESEIDWDPIEEVLEDSRGGYIELIRSFLWMDLPQESPKDDKEIVAPVKENEAADATPLAEQPLPSSKKSKARKKNKSKPETTAASTSATIKVRKEPDKSLIETKEEVRERLAHGVDFTTDNIRGLMVAGTVENPVITTKTITFPEGDIARLLTEIAEIKQYLFCRLILAHVALLPAAVRANSIEDFLADKEVSIASLRDVCLKMENPGIQDVRDACADLFRTDHEEHETIDDGIVVAKGVKDSTPKDSKYDEMILQARRKKGDLPEKWVPKREKENTARQLAEAMGQIPTAENMGLSGEGTAINFEYSTDQGTTFRKKIRIKLCGLTVWSYPNDKALTRGGWLHFCIIAKDCSLYDAVYLCRHWDEFFELNVLAVFGYFPGKNWAEWVGDRSRQQMLQLGFIMYCESSEPDAMDLTTKVQHGSSRGQGRRTHAVFEARNFICAYIKRDDQSSRRMIQYLSMQSHRLLVLVRDAESGKLLVRPEEKERWLFRQKSGLGRASKNDGWNVIKQVGPQFWEEMDEHRQWNFSFKEYYDVYVWDLEPGERFAGLYNCVQETLIKALRISSGPDLYNLMSPILRTIYRDEDTHRVRDIRPGQKVESIYDEIHHEGSRVLFRQVDRGVPMGIPGAGREKQAPRNFFYNEADALEDQVLFPEEREDSKSNPLDVGSLVALRKWEDEGFSMRKFVEGFWDSDWSEYEDEDEEEDEEEEDDEDGNRLIKENGEDSWDDALDESDQDVDEDDEDLQEPHILEAKLESLGLSDETRTALMRLATIRKDTPEPDPGNPQVMREEFMSFLDKEKSRIFKEVWHKADTEPNAQSHYIEMLEMTRKSRIFNHCANPSESISLLLSVRLIDQMRISGSDMADLQKSIAKITPFFNPEFFQSKHGEKYKDSLLFNQAERAKNLPDIRTHLSCKMRPKDHYEAFDKECKNAHGDVEELPLEWDIAIRPIIAQLYKSGVIRTRPDTYYEGTAMCYQESHRSKPDLFIDWRGNLHTIKMPPSLVDPHSIAPFIPTAAVFGRKHPSARFAVLTLWSAPHFYPLMIGEENRDGNSFRDLVGRVFVWMFVPKDMGCSEWSIHNTAAMRIAPWKRYFGDRVVVKRDKYLIMGTDAEDLLRLVAGVTHAVQMRPWRWEVDLWKSWINVDLKFLEGLDQRWLD